MIRLIYLNMILNTVFLLMAFAEMTGITSIHESLPWWFKWCWIIALTIGNLIIHVLQLRKV